MCEKCSANRGRHGRARWNVAPGSLGSPAEKLVVITDVFEGEKIQEAGKPLAAGTWDFGLRWDEHNHETGIL
jgi:hypothetical protein